MRPHLPQIAVVTDVIPNSILLDVFVCLRRSGTSLRHLESFQYRTGIIFTSTQVVDFAAPGGGVEFVKKARYIFGVNVVAHLLTLVAVNLIFTPLKIALDQVT